jgi:hypothetical protein
MYFRLGAFALVAAALALTVLRYAPPEPLAKSAPAAEFSAGRARVVLARLLGDGKPHPVGSDANVAVRERLADELRRIGLEPELQRGFSCAAFGACAEVVNVLARVPGRQAGSGVLVASHYDSVGAGPGAADDAAGVAAALELARALRAQPAERNVLLLFTDGEEAGLLGARLFVKSHPALREVRSAVNLEARGTTGPSVMFETSTGNDEIVRSFSAGVSRPVTGSLFYAVYRQLPNDSDFSVLREAGLSGVNLAFIGGFARYHTPRDDLLHLDLGSVQHQGQTALQAVRALAEEPPAALGGEDRVFFDVFSLFVVHWARSWTLPLVALATLLIVVVLARSFARRALGLGALLRASGIFVAALACAAVVGLGLETLWRASGALPSPWLASPLAARCATALGALLPVAVLPAIVRELDETALFSGAALGFLTLAWSLVLLLPEASQLALVPALAGGAAGLFGARPGSLALLAGALCVLLPVNYLLYDALGLTSVAAASVAWWLAWSPLFAVFARPAPRTLPSLVVFAALVASAGVAAALAPFSPESPQRLTLTHHEDTTARRARWLVDAPWGTLPEAFAGLHAWQPSTEPRIQPWAWAPELLQALAPALGARGPGVEVTSDTRSQPERQVTLRVHPSPRTYATILLAPGSAAIGSVTIEGQTVGFRWAGTQRVYTVVGRPDGFEVKLALRGHARLLIADWIPGLPSSAGALVAARNASAVPSQAGDATVVSRTLDL